MGRPVARVRVRVPARNHRPVLTPPRPLFGPRRDRWGNRGDHGPPRVCPRSRDQLLASPCPIPPDRRVACDLEHLRTRQDAWAQSLCKVGPLSHERDTERVRWMRYSDLEGEMATTLDEA